MKPNSIIWTLAFVMILGCSVLIACSSNDLNDAENNGGIGNEGNSNNTSDSADSVAEEETPVTVTIADKFNSEDFAQLQEHVTEQFPHITLEEITVGRTSEGFQEAIAANQVPDIIRSMPLHHYYFLQELNLLTDLTPLIEQNNYDLSRFDQDTLEGIRSYSREGLEGLPYARAAGIRDYGLMGYNKDIFDAFGESYPTNDMNWDELVALIPRVTGEIDGHHYYGFKWLGAGEGPVETMPVNQPLLDPQTHEPLLDNYAWRRGIDYAQRISTIPGVYLDGETVADSGTSNIVEGNVAIFDSYRPQFLPNFIENRVNFDVFVAPKFEEEPNEYPINTHWGYNITSTSEHPNEAFKVLTVLLSDEWLTYENLREGEPSRIPLNDNAVLESFPTDPAYEETNHSEVLEEASIVHAPAAPMELSPFNDVIRNGFFRDEMHAFIISNGDPVTFIREMEERIRIEVEELQAQQ